MATVAVKHELIEWARLRANRSIEELSAKYEKYLDWERGISRPTLRQLEWISRQTLTPLGYFFLDSPPNEDLPVKDFRTLDDRSPRRPSPNLLETVQVMQQRQNWLRDELVAQGEDALQFVGSFRTTASAIRVAAAMRQSLGIKADWTLNHTSWDAAQRALRHALESIGIIVVQNGIVGNNTHRKLDVEEFRGFVLCDKYAPLIFINGADADSAQMFTMAHEAAHLWLGEGGVFDLVGLLPSKNAIERKCNEIAAEFLVPAKDLMTFWSAAKPNRDLYVISRSFRVSPIVAARRAYDLDLISESTFFGFLNEYQEGAKSKSDDDSKGGNFYTNQNLRIGRRFARAIFRAVNEGRLLYRDAYELTGLKGKTFDTFEKLIENEVSR